MKNSIRSLAIIAGLLITPLAQGQFSHELSGDKYPWTSIPQVKGDNFRFVIIGDLTGGEKEGVFASVIEKINQMSPDFVMCVGDLIDGYTIDSQVMNNQWKSFHKRIAKLRVPFFYMPGNHDVANRMLYNEWKRLYGYDYYSFHVSGTLFLILDCYEGNKGELSEEQTAYVKSVLAKHDPAEPVCVFSHPPLWPLTGKKGLNELMPLFSRYKTTFFCGDDHHYIKKNADGQIHYMLSNTGGGFDIENISLGIFNHFLWVTSLSGELSVANILTDGIIPADIVNNSNEKQVYSLLRDEWLGIRPTFVTSPTSGILTSELSAFNKGEIPLNISGNFASAAGVSFQPDSFRFTVPPGKAVTIPVSLLNPSGVATEDLPEPVAEINAEYLQSGMKIENTYSKKWTIDALRYCSPSGDAEIFTKVLNPAYIEESWSWSGPEDGNWRFSCVHDEKNVIIRIFVKDDKTIADSVRTGTLQDKLYIHFAADTTLVPGQYLKFELSAGSKPVLVNTGNFPASGIKSICSLRMGQLFAEVRIPLKHLKGDFFRINVGFRDQDDLTSSDQSILWWRPLWGSRSDYPGAGRFRIRYR